MRWKSQWIFLLVLLLMLVAYGAVASDQELKPAPDVTYTTVQEMVETPKISNGVVGSDYVLYVNACQTCGFASLAFIVLMAAHNLIQLRTPMMLTRYSTYYAFRRRVFCQLFAFSVVFMGIATALLLLVERTALYTGLGKQLFVSIQFYPIPFALYVLHMLLSIAMLCLYQSLILLVRRCALSQVIPIAFFISNAMNLGTWMTRINPFFFMVTDHVRTDELPRIVLTYVLCFGLLFFFLRKPKRDYVGDVKNE